MLACCITILTPLSLTAGDIGGESEALTLDLEEAVDKELGVRFSEVDFTGGGAEFSWETKTTTKDHRWGFSAHTHNYRTAQQNQCRGKLEFWTFEINFLIFQFLLLGEWWSHSLPRLRKWINPCPPLPFLSNEKWTVLSATWTMDYIDQSFAIAQDFGSSLGINTVDVFNCLPKLKS